MATGMKRSIRKSDMIARIGGDEFVIFLKGISSRQQAEEKASQLLTMIRNLFSEEKQTAYITCSIGIAVYPEDGKTFQELYHCADLALYDAKKQGKNQYRIFNPKKIALME